MIKTREQFIYKTNLAKFRVKIKSLAEEAKIIRFEFKKNVKNYFDVYSSIDTQTPLWCESVGQVLQWHNDTVVRREQRHTLLAYAYYRGIPYKQVEPKTNKPVCVEKIKRILKSLTGSSDINLIYKWINE